jgi:hypothetical protein
LPFELIHHELCLAFALQALGRWCILFVSSFGALLLPLPARPCGSIRPGLKELAHEAHAGGLRQVDQKLVGCNCQRSADLQPFVVPVSKPE